MIYKEYGRTGVELSTIGFGGMRFDDQDDVDKCASLIYSIYYAGVNYFDTAPGYGKSEDLFGVAFKEMNKTRVEKPFYVSTKTAKENPAQVRRDLETSLKRMNLDYIDFYHVWCLVTPEQYQRRKANGVLKEFEKLKQEGLVKHICVSTHMTGFEIGDMMNDYPFEGVTLGYSAMNFAYREAGLEAAAKLNRGVVVMNPLGGGLITQHPDRFDFVRTQENETIVEGALHFLMNDPRITVALIGMGNENHLKDAVHAVENFRSIETEKIEKIRSSLKDSFNELCTGCRYCDNCPEGIPVPKMMESYNHLLLSSKAKTLVDRMYWHWGITTEDDYSSRCVECGLCEEECTQKLPIINRLKEIKYEIDQYLAEKKS
jgi:uncharacterized protein